MTPFILEENDDKRTNKLIFSEANVARWINTSIAEHEMKWSQRMYDTMAAGASYAILIPQSRPNLSKIQETDEVYKLLLEINKFTREQKSNVFVIMGSIYDN